MEYINNLSKRIIGFAIGVHESLGPGLLESAYRECLLFELIKSGLKVEKEKPMPIIYKDFKFGLLINFNLSLLKKRY